MSAWLGFRDRLVSQFHVGHRRRRRRRRRQWGAPDVRTPGPHTGWPASIIVEGKSCPPMTRTVTRRYGGRTARASHHPRQSFSPPSPAREQGASWHHPKCHSLPRTRSANDGPSWHHPFRRPRGRGNLMIMQARTPALPGASSRCPNSYAGEDACAPRSPAANGGCSRKAQPNCSREAQPNCSREAQPNCSHNSQVSA